MGTKPLKVQIYDFIKEFKSVPTSMLLVFFGKIKNEDGIKYILHGLKNNSLIYQTEDNHRTSLNKMYSSMDMDPKVLDALWVMVANHPKDVKLYSLLRQKEYPKVLLYSVDDTLFELSVLEPSEETLYTATIQRDIQQFHNEQSVNIAIVYTQKSGEKAISELGYDAYCLLAYQESKEYPTPTFYYRAMP